MPPLDAADASESPIESDPRLSIFDLAIITVLKHNPLKVEAAIFLSQKNMGLKRKLKDGLNPPAKHRYSLRSKSKCKQFELENFCSRFPHLSEDILGELDYKSLVKFRKVSKFWYKNINEQRIFCIRQIEQCTEKFTELVSQHCKCCVTSANAFFLCCKNRKILGKCIADVSVPKK